MSAGSGVCESVCEGDGGECREWDVRVMLDMLDSEFGHPLGVNTLSDQPARPRMMLCTRSAACSVHA